jgi:hypothetical protein
MQQGFEFEALTMQRPTVLRLVQGSAARLHSQQNCVQKFNLIGSLK